MTDSSHSRRVHLEGARKEALETSRSRLVVTSVLFAVAFAVISGRLVELAIFEDPQARATATASRTVVQSKSRADILDRNGILLATSVPTASVYANPRHLLDARDAARRIVTVFPEVNEERLFRRLNSERTFVWIRRNITPNQQFAINALGLPGIYFRRTERRVYPHGSLTSHVVGTTDIDAKGLTGIERSFDGPLQESEQALALSLDVRVQSVVRRALNTAIEKFSAVGGAGIVVDVTNGEVLALVSLPDFEPHFGGDVTAEARFNRVTKGVYEMGSTFKLFTTAMALDTRTIGLNGGFDATKPLRVARFVINDYHAKKRWLSVPEILVHSSNIGAAKMGVAVGTKTQQAYLHALGLTRKARLELPEIGVPLIPSPWRKISTMTISYGHGIAVSPLQMANGVAALVNGGILRDATLALSAPGAVPAGVQVIKTGTSIKMRRLMRLVVRRGTGKNAEVEGYLVGGKTGTADKPGPGGYAASRRVISSFVGAFPIDRPRYVVLAMLDEPKGTAETFGYATGGWVAAPVVREIVAALGPMMGMAPSTETERLPRPGDPLHIAAGKPSQTAGNQRVRGQSVRGPSRATH